MKQATGTGADGQVVYQDQESLRRYSRTAQPVKKKEVDQVGRGVVLAVNAFGFVFVNPRLCGANLEGKC